MVMVLLSSRGHCISIKGPSVSNVSAWPCIGSWPAHHTNARVRQWCYFPFLPGWIADEHKLKDHPASTGNGQRAGSKVDAVSRTGRKWLTPFHSFQCPNVFIFDNRRHNIHICGTAWRTGWYLTFLYSRYWMCPYFFLTFPTPGSQLQFPIRSFHLISLLFLSYTLYIHVQ